MITDTTSDLSEEFIKEYNIQVLPFRIIYKDREYRDKLDITPKEVYDNLENEVPTSSLPSMKDMDDMLSNLEKQGYTHVIAVTLSSGLSGIYNAFKIVSENHPNIKTYICDSKSISMGEGIIVKECAEMVREGKKFEEIIKEIPNIQKRTKLFFVVGTLEYLKKGGRIGKVSGTIGELLNIKPIIAVDSNDGKYYTFDKVRGRKQSINRLLNTIKNIIKDAKHKIYVCHGNALEESKKICDSIRNYENVEDVCFAGEISPVSGVHSGPGLVGVVLVREP